MDFLKLLGAGAGSLFLSGPTSAWAEPATSPAGGLQNPSVGESTINAHFVHRGPGFGRRVALTFDDGPSPGVTERILAELERRKLTATFFMIGNKVRAYASLAREVAAAGHELANHTFTHPSLNRLDDSRVREELTRCQDAIGEATGKTPTWFRPPYGAFRHDQGHMPRRQHLGVAYWSVDPRDWARPGAGAITNHILTQAQAGSIILLHDLHKQTADAIPAVLDGLIDKGFFLAPISGFLGDPYGPFTPWGKTSAA